MEPAQTGGSWFWNRARKLLKSSGMGSADSSGFARILVIQLRQMGDVLLCTPALRALRKKFPEARIAFLVDKPFEPLLRHNPDVDALIARDPAESFEPVRSIARVRRFAPQLVIDYLANPRTALITLLSGAGITLSYANKRRAFLYKLKAKPEGGYVAQEKLSLLKPLGIESAGLELTLNYPESAAAAAREILSGFGIRENDFLAALDLFHKRPARQWPPKYFIETADRLAEKFGAKVVITCLPQNRARAQEAAALARQKHFIASGLDLFQLAALLKRANLFLGADAGTKHVAVSQNTPTFTILGPSGEQWTMPSPIHQTASVELDCRPCSFHHCPVPGHPCQKNLTPEMARQKLEQFIDRLRGAAGRI